MHPRHQKYRSMHLSQARHGQSSNRSNAGVQFTRGLLLLLFLLLRFLVFFFKPLGSNPRKRSVFWTEFTCTRPMTVLPHPGHPNPPSLAAAHAAGWRSRRRQQISRTQERGENGRRERSVLPDRRAQCLILSSVLPALIASTWMWSPACACVHSADRNATMLEFFHCC